MPFRPETGRLSAIPFPSPRWRCVLIAFGWGAGALVCAVCGAGLFAYAQLAAANDGAAALSTETAYTFGYASAANAVCADLPLDVVSAEMAADPQGRISPDIARGFADFSSTLETAGADHACSAAARFIRVRQ